MAEFIGLEVSNVNAILEALLKLPADLIDTGADAALYYWRGALRNPANYPPYRYVSRAQAYPDAPYRPGYFSARQFRYVMWLMNNGYQPGPQNRTFALAKSWEKVGSGERGYLYSNAPYASFVIGDGTQARQPALVGWLQSTPFVEQPRLVAGAERAIVAAVEKEVRRRLPK